jgi:molybdate transport system substrate-binding protein
MPNDHRPVRAWLGGRSARRVTALLLMGVIGQTWAQAVPSASTVRVLAAGSLRAALTDVARAFEVQEPGSSVVLGFGASGLLKDRLLAGERADVFASANMEHPAALAQQGRAAKPQAFAGNRLCALHGPAVDVTPDNLVQRLLDPAIRVGTSTPKADPSGDYTWQMFERIEAQGRPGAFKLLSEKALQLTGGPSSPPPPPDRNVYGVLVAAGQADIFITYCTNAVVAQAEQPTLRRAEVPAAINVSASYGVAVLQGASPGAQRLVDFMLSPAGQALLAKRGFAPP